MWQALDDENRLDRMDEFFSEEYRRHSDEGTMTREEFRESLARLHEGFPDLTAEVAEVVTDGSTVAYRWTVRGTHEGEYMGAPATGRRVEARGITISRFGEDGRIVEDQASWNRSSVLHQLGIIPIS